jgi:MoaA/NifB/PqqE/SkfB family radical SAM enzyme
MSSATIYLTNECNLRCKHCFVGHDQLRPRAGLSTEDAQAVIANFAASGIKTITLLGGEVTTERHDLADILRFSEARGVAVSINTNLVDPAPLLPLLDSAALTNIVVSVDGLTASTHDRIRGTGTFAKTASNLAILARHPRVADGSLTVDLTFVLTALNKADVYALPRFAKQHGINKINFKTLQFNDRAAQNRTQLQLTDKELLDTCTAFYVYCLLEGGINLDMHIPPAFGYYLDKVASAPEHLWNFESCGGTQVYTYVDLYGNNLPCPAMSLEENVDSNLRARSSALSAVANPIAQIQARSLFRGFDRSVAQRHRNAAMEPCRDCIFSARCSPCTNEIIRGHDHGRVDICAAVRKHGNDRIPGLSDELFGHAAQDATGAVVTAV